jgi:hypothetical protein
MEIYGFPVDLEVFNDPYDGIRVTFGTPPRITL